MIVSNSHPLAVRVSTIVLLSMFVLPIFGQDDPPEKLLELLEKAAQGHAAAQSKLGVMYTNGQGVPQDDGEAVKWFRAAAEQGHAGAQSNLGLMYREGRGVPHYVQAHMWYNLAASQSSGEDRETAAKNRDDIAKKMTPEQIAEAQRLAREWKPKSSGSQ